MAHLQRVASSPFISGSFFSFDTAASPEPPSSQEQFLPGLGGPGNILKLSLFHFYFPHWFSVITLMHGRDAVVEGCERGDEGLENAEVKTIATDAR